MLKALAILLLCAAPLRGQLIDNQWLNHHAFDHLVSGVVLDLGVRGPWVAKSWRDTPLKRVAIVGGISTAYEVVQLVPPLRKAFGMTWEGKYPTKYVILDVAASVVTAGLTEFAIHHIRKWVK